MLWSVLNCRLACKQNDFAKTKISNKDTYFDVSSVTVHYTFCQKPQNKITILSFTELPNYRTVHFLSRSFHDVKQIWTHCQRRKNATVRSKLQTKHFFNILSLSLCNLRSNKSRARKLAPSQTHRQHWSSQCTSHTYKKRTIRTNNLG